MHLMFWNQHDAIKRLPKPGLREKTTVDPTA